MYVAITRARKRLYITMAQQRTLHGQTQFGIVSASSKKSRPKYCTTCPSKTAYDSYGNTRQLPRSKTKSSTTTNSRKPTQASASDKTSATANWHLIVIIDAADKGESARLTINFGKQGVKELDTKLRNWKRCSGDGRGRLKTGTTIFAQTSAVIPAQAGIRDFRHGNLSDKRFF